MMRDFAVVAMNNYLCVQERNRDEREGEEEERERERKRMSREVMPI